MKPSAHWAVVALMAVIAFVVFVVTHHAAT
jgi:hypothetical protein